MSKPTIVIQFPEDTSENVDQIAQELAQGMADGGYEGVVVTLLEPDTADFVDYQIINN